MDAPTRADVKEQRMQIAKAAFTEELRDAMLMWQHCNQQANGAKTHAKQKYFAKKREAAKRTALRFTEMIGTLDHIDEQ